MSVLQNILPTPTGVISRYVGSTGGATTRYYWIQAIYPGGFSGLGGSQSLTIPSSLDHNNQVYIQWTPMAGAIGYLVFTSTTSTAPAQGSILIGTTTAPNFTDQGQSNSGSTQTAAVVIGGGISCARAQYSFATDGGAIGLITPSLSDVIPANAILVAGTVNVTTAVTSAGSATVAIGTSAGSSASALLAATAKASLTLDALINAVPVFATPVKMTAAGTITFTVATAVLTAGIIEVFIFYVVPINS